MQNCDLEIEKNKLTLRIDLGKTVGPSQSGKTLLVATTGGNITIAGGFRLGLNLYKKNPDYVPDAEDEPEGTAPKKRKARKPS